MEKKCLRCGKAFTGKRSDSKFCSDTCKAKNWEEKNKHKLEGAKLDKDALPIKSGLTDKSKDQLNPVLEGLPPFDNLIGSQENKSKDTTIIPEIKKEPEEKEAIGPSKYITKIIQEPNPGYVSCSDRLIECRKEITRLLENVSKLDKIIEQEQKSYWQNAWLAPDKAKKNKENAERAKKVKEECFRLLPIYRDREKELTQELKHHPATFEKEKEVLNPFYYFYKNRIKKAQETETLTHKEPEKDEAEDRDKQEASKGILSDDFDQKQNNKPSETKEPEPNDHYETDKIISMKNLGKREIVKLNFSSKWKEFLGLPQPNFCCVVYGMSGQGKSHLAMLFGKYLAERFGRVLYISGEEGFQASFLDKVEKLGVKIDRYYAAELHSGQEILDHVPDQYHFIILDSVNNLNIDPKMLKAIQNKFSKSGIIALCQCVKDGKIRGSYQIVHDGNILIKVEKGKAYTEKNRFGEIDTVFNVWEVYDSTKNAVKKKHDPKLDDDFNNTVK